MNPAAPLCFDTPPGHLSGVVYCTMLNDPRLLRHLGDAVNQPPYLAPPRAPVLSIKPRNTLTADGSLIPVPSHAPCLETGASLGIVIKRPAYRVQPADATSYIAGYTIVNDLHIPHQSFHRPSLASYALDRSCPIGPRVVERDEITNPDELEIWIFVDNTLQQATSTRGRTRNIATLLADVSEFMTLCPGDILTTGASFGAPQLSVGQSVAVEIAGIGRLCSRLVSEAEDGR